MNGIVSCMNSNILGLKSVFMEPNISQVSVHDMILQTHISAENHFISITKHLVVVDHTTLQEGNPTLQEEAHESLGLLI